MLKSIMLVVRTALRVDKRRAVLVLVLAPVLGGLSATQGLGVAWLIDGVAGSRPDLTLMGAGLVVLTTGVIYQVGLGLIDIRIVLQQRVGMELDTMLMRGVAGRASLDHFHDPDFLDDVELVRQRRGELGQSFGSIIENADVFSRFTANLVLLMTAGPIYALLPLCTIPLVFATRYSERLIADTEKACAQTDRRRKELFGISTSPSAAREVRLYRLGPELAARHRKAYLSVNKALGWARLRGALAVALAWAVYALALFGCLVMVVLAVHRGAATVGDVVLVAVLGRRLTENTTGLGVLVAWLRRSMHTIGIYRRLIDVPADNKAAEPGSPGDIVLSGVSFSYPGAETNSLSDVDLRLPAGSTVAVVGSNGSGKSTLVALLAGLYRPVSGTIAGVGRVTACFQDFSRYELLTRQAVGVGDPSLVDDRRAVTAAVTRAGADRVIGALPEGLETPLGRASDGTELSTGQWQLLGLARARMPEESDLVLLDEPAAGLDPDAEVALLSRYLRGGAATTVIVSHRLTTVRSADLIVVLDRGRVIEIGAHEDLMASNGHYARLYALQSDAYTTT